jgi:hypothetical protein
MKSVSLFVCASRSEIIKIIVLPLALSLAQALSGCKFFEPPESSGNAISSNAGDACVTKSAESGIKLGLLAEGDDSKSAIVDVGGLMIQEMKSGLLSAGLVQSQADFIASQASDSLATAIGGLVIDPSAPTQSQPLALATAPILRGALTSLSDECANLVGLDQRSQVVKLITSSTVGSFGGRTAGMAAGEVHTLLAQVSSVAVESMPAAGLSGPNLSQSVKAIAGGAVEALPKAGIDAADRANAAKNIAKGAVSAIDEAGAGSSEIGDIAGAIASTSVEALAKSGLSVAELIQSDAIAEITSGAIAGLKDVKLSAEQIADALGTVAADVVVTLGGLEGGDAESKLSALGEVMDGAMAAISSLQEDTELDVSDAVGNMTRQVTSSLMDAGFESSQMAHATATMLESAIEGISKLEIDASDSVTSLAAKMIESAMEGAASILASGSIDMTSMTAIAQESSKSAVNAMVTLQDSGMLKSESDISGFVAKISSSISAGIERGGASASAVSAVATSVESVMTSGQVQNKIQTAKQVYVPPVANLSFNEPNQAAWQNVWVGNSISVNFTLNNTGDATATNLSDLSLPNGFSVADQTCGSSLAASSSCQYTVAFNPTSASSYSGSMTVSYSNGTENATTSRAISGLGTGNTLVVQPTYSVAPNWLDYANAGTNTTCTTGNACDHGGEFRSVAVNGYSSCDGLSMVDSESWFYWGCFDLGQTVEFRTKRLKMNIRLEDLIDTSDAPSFDWKQNSVVLKSNGTTITTSTPSRWWSNPIEDLPDTSTATALHELATPGKIYLVRDNALSKGLSFTAERQALIVFNGKTLKLTASPIGMLLNAADAYHKLWIEGSYDMNGQASNAITIGADNEQDRAHYFTMRHAAFRGSTSQAQGIAGFGSYHRYENVVISDNVMGGGGVGGGGMRLYVTKSFLYNIRANNLGNRGIEFEYGAENNLIHNVIVSNSLTGIIFGQHAKQNTMTNYLAINNNGVNAPTINIHSAANNLTMVSGAIINNEMWGMEIGTNNNRFHNLVMGKSGDYDILSNNSNLTNIFSGKISIDAGDECSFASATSSIVAKSVAQTGCEAASGVTGLTYTEHAHSFNNVFVGFVASDSVNTVDVNGSTVASDITTASQWHRFENNFRVWTRQPNAPFPTAAFYGRCDGNCQIFDLRLKSSDSILRSVNGAFIANATCPASVHGDQVITDGVAPTPNKFLAHAQEIVDDAFGDNDGLCESNESCIYSPNIGVYQGEGDYTTQRCNFVDGGTGNVTGVTMYAYPVNGQ